VYKALLCWRYLLTRYLALACIISVMLGVATLIVVNSVMSGFSSKLRDRLHSLLSDIVLDSRGAEGFADPAGTMAKIRSDPFLNARIEAMTPTMEVPAMFQYYWPDGERVTRLVRFVGVDVNTRGQVGGFTEHIVDQGGKHVAASFEIPEDARKRYEVRHQFLQVMQQQQDIPLNPDEPPPPAPTPSQLKLPTGIIVGNLLASFRQKNDQGETVEKYLLNPGDAVIITTMGGQRMTPVYDRFVVANYFKSEMSEYDSQYVFVPLSYLQHLRSLPDQVTSIQIKLKDYRDAEKVVESLETLFPPNGIMRVETWEQKQGPLLAAIRVEKGILNVLLFLIIGVAGFGILAIFTMIVAEKTRDIGILKALGASNGGVMKIFLGYGLLLGVVGAWLGTLLGMTLTNHINEVEKFLSRITGQDIFPRDIYYFNQIPTDMQLWMVALVDVGAVAIAVLSSVLPALRAAMLHPVRALRYE
jgi:lipoprotein-releasing system permease protein